MTSFVQVGSTVHTPMGKGVVREVRNGGTVLVEVQGRALVLRAADVTAFDSGRPRRPASPPSVTTTLADAPVRDDVPVEIDLHGLTVEEALATSAEAVNAALLAHRLELRFIHGRSGGRIRGALHRWLREIPSVASFRLDPRNPGVTVVML